MWWFWLVLFECLERTLIISIGFGVVGRSSQISLSKFVFQLSFLRWHFFHTRFFDVILLHSVLQLIYFLLKSFSDHLGPWIGFGRSLERELFFGGRFFDEIVLVFEQNSVFQIGEFLILIEFLVSLSWLGENAILPLSLILMIRILKRVTLCDLWYVTLCDLWFVTLCDLWFVFFIKCENLTLFSFCITLFIERLWF